MQSKGFIFLPSGSMQTLETQSCATYTQTGTTAAAAPAGIPHLLQESLRIILLLLTAAKKHTIIVIYLSFYSFIFTHIHTSLYVCVYIYNYVC